MVTPLKSLAEVDQEMTEDKHFSSSMSTEDMKKMSALEASSIAWEETNLFAIRPKMSYVSDSRKKADPSFWGQQ